MAKNKGGRPTVFTPKVLQLLEDAFANDATDEQACFLAGISTSSLYNYQEENKGYLERKAALRGMIKYKAKLNIKGKIDGGDIEVSKWYAERRDKDFKPKSDLTSDGQKLPTPIYGGQSTAISRHTSNSKDI